MQCSYEESSANEIGTPNDVRSGMTSSNEESSTVQDRTMMANDTPGSSQSFELDGVQEDGSTLTVKKDMNIENLNEAGKWIIGKVDPERQVENTNRTGM